MFQQGQIVEIRDGRAKENRMLGKFGLVTLALSSLTGLANAADFAPAPPDESDWVFTAAPYAWLAGINGSVGAFGQDPVDIDLSFSDVLKNFDVGLMGAGEARNGRFSIASDFMWVKLSGDRDLPPVLGGGNVELTAETLTVTGLGGYSLIYGDGGNLDVVAGARLWSVSNALDFSVLGSFDDSATWVDPVVGLKGRANISPNFFVTGWALAGGFGVSSDLMWDAMGSVGYEFNDTFSMTAGYRALSVDYHNNGFVYDVVQSGPILGAVFKF
jgi:hypothetical protein